MHEELRRLLPAYAAGALDEGASESVRAHLVTGCPECLAEVYSRPVGLPRNAPDAIPVRSSPARPVPAGRTGLLVAIAVLSIALGAAIAGMVVELRRREADSRSQAQTAGARVAAAEADRARLAGRVDALERAMTETRGELSQHVDAVRQAAEEKARLESELAASREQIETLTRGLRGHRRELERLRVEDPEKLRGFLTDPEAELLRLDPVPPFRDVRGHALSSADGDAALVYAFGLPALPPGSAYRARLRFGDGREVIGGPFRVDGRGEAVIRLPTGAARPAEIEVMLEPAERPVLAWRRRASD